MNIYGATDVNLDATNTTLKMDGQAAVGHIDMVAPLQFKFSAGTKTWYMHNGGVLWMPTATSPDADVTAGKLGYFPDTHLYFANGTAWKRVATYDELTAMGMASTALGGTGIDSSASTGVAQVNTGTWSFTTTLQSAVQANITHLGTQAANLIFTDATYDIGASGATRPRSLYLSANATLGANLVVGGTTTLTGDIISDLLFTDATYDIGKTGATRPRDLFLSRNAVIGGTLDVTGASTFDTNTLVVDAANNRVGILNASPSTALDVTGTVTSTLLSVLPSSATSGDTGSLHLRELAANGVEYTGFKSPDSLAATVVYTLPSADGTTGQVLSTNGSKILSWSTGSSSGMSNPLTTTGDMVYSSGTTTPARLGIGTTGQCLIVTGGLPVWGSCSGGVSVPGSNTQIIFNDAGVEAGSASLTFNKTTLKETISGSIAGELRGLVIQNTSTGNTSLSTISLGNDVQESGLMLYMSSSTTVGGANYARVKNILNAPLILGTNNTDQLTITAGGNLNFEGTGKRITGDLSNATTANRLLFQSSATNGSTMLGVIPNGTSTVVQFQLFNGSDPANASLLRLFSTNAISAIDSTKAGTGSYLPFELLVAGGVRFYSDIAGNNGINTNTPSGRFQVNSGTNLGGIQIGVGAASLNYFDADTQILRTGTGTELARLTSTGLGIGKTAASALDVKGTFRLSGATSGYVGLAPAAVAGSVTYTLPPADGSSGQYLSTDGSATLSWSSPSISGAITSLGGQTGATQTFVNDTNITMTSGTNTHTLGWASTLSLARGGTGGNTGSITGTGALTFTSGSSGLVSLVSGSKTYGFDSTGSIRLPSQTAALTPTAGWFGYYSGGLYYSNGTNWYKLATTAELPSPSGSPSIPFINAADYGLTAGACNTILDNTTAIQNAINAASSSTLYAVAIPSGTYCIKSGLTITSGVTLYGAGQNNTNISADIGFTGTEMLTINTTAQVNIKSLEIQGTLAGGSVPTLNGILVTRAGPGSTFDDLYLTSLVLGIDIRRSPQATITRSNLTSIKTVGIAIQNTNGDDEGDYYIAGNIINLATYATSNPVGVYQINSGGIKLIGNKILYGYRGYSGDFTLANSSTSILIISGNSIEMQTSIASVPASIYLNTNTLNSSYYFDEVAITGNQLVGSATAYALYVNGAPGKHIDYGTVTGNTINGQIYMNYGNYWMIASNTFKGTPTGGSILISPGCTGSYIGINNYGTNSTLPVSTLNGGLTLTGSGLLLGNATGGDKGVGTINATDYYLNGSLLDSDLFTVGAGTKFWRDDGTWQTVTEFSNVAARNAISGGSNISYSASTGVIDVSATPTFTSLILAGSLTAPGGITSGNISSGQITASGNIRTYGYVDAVGNVYAGGGVYATTGVFLGGYPYTFPDYVFDQHFTGTNTYGYKGLMPIDKLEEYVKINRRLPSDTRGDKIELFDKNRQAWQAIEELSLYIISLQKQLNELKAKVN
jgi:hypothetical protein